MNRIIPFFGLGRIRVGAEQLRICLEQLVERIAVSEQPFVSIQVEIDGSGGAHRTIGALSHDERRWFQFWAGICQL